MPANEVLAGNPEVRQRPPQIASWKHLVEAPLLGASDHATPHRSCVAQNPIAKAGWMAHLPSHLLDNAEARWD
jgi:hypothetical protein